MARPRGVVDGAKYGGLTVLKAFHDKHLHLTVCNKCNRETLRSTTSLNHRPPCCRHCAAAGRRGLTPKEYVAYGCWTVLELWAAPSRHLCQCKCGEFKLLSSQVVFECRGRCKFCAKKS